MERSLTKQKKPASKTENAAPLYETGTHQREQVKERFHPLTEYSIKLSKPLAQTRLGKESKSLYTRTVSQQTQ